MKEVTLLQSDLRPNMEVLRSSLGAGPSLENRILTHASSFVLQAPSWATLTSSCPALCPSSLSSTTSSSPLLSTSSSLLSSSLLSTENTQLKSSPLSVSTLCSSQPLNAPVQSTAPPAAEKVSGLSGEHGELEIDEDESCSTDELRSHSDDVSEISDHEQQTEIDGETRDEMPVLDLRMTDDEEEQKLDVDEGFEEFDPGSDRDAELLKEKKYKLLNLVCCSLVNKTSSPGQLDWDSDTTVWSKIKLLGTAITLSDPEFLLKVAVYTRQELNIRVTANFLLALAAHLPESKPHLRRYFCSAIQLPSDWLEVTRIYSTCFSKSLPSGLKKGLVDKFKQFNEYQLAKYNTRKHCGKHKKKRTAKEVSDQQWDEWARLVGADTYKLQRHLKMDQRAAVDKKQSEFNMKKLIKRLHIKEPAELVMGILGKKYPADARAFWRSGLSGMWQSERANQRMTLKRVETWETQLSQEGNNATTWEKLLDNNSLPFMAMLRNLRNMVMAGISHKHHDQILNRLCSKSAVIKSRQFPFRFLSAYKVILELDSSSVSGSAKLKTSSKEILRGILKTIPKSGKYKRLDWSTASRQRLRNALRVPFVRRFYYTKLRALQKARQRRISPELLQRYREALDKAVQISCRHNIPPLPGHTLIIVLDSFCSKKLKRADFSLPPECSDGNTEETNLSPTPQEAGLLLAMMIRFCSEHTQFLLGDDRAVREVQIEEGGLLENVRKVNKLVEDFSDSTEKIPHSEFFSKLLEDKIKVDNIICLSDYSVDWWMMLAVKRFQKLSVTQPLVVNILLTASSHFEDSNDPNTVTLCGFSEQILRFVSERGSSRLLDHVEQIDKLHKIPPPADSSAKHERTVDVVPLPEVPKLRWRGVRVFISSTFRDMHGERDVLIRSVFPELRRRAAALCLHLQEVDLRWGVTEDESERATEICLQEVCRSQVLLGILGQRYGVVPPRPSLPDLPIYSWLKSAPDGLSITEMEIRQFQAVFPDSPQSRAFFYFRSPQLLNSVPEAWRRDFIAESEETADKVGALKERIKNDGFKVTENYPCEWGGVVDGKAYVSALDVFAKAVMEDLWTAIEKLFVEESDAADLTAEIKEQEVHQDAQRRQFYGRTKLLSKAKDKIKECQQKGGVLLVEGGAGVGKTAFMAALAHTLQTPEKMKNAPMCDVISYTTAASQSAAGVEPLLRCLDQWLRKRKQKEEALTSDTPYRDLLSEFLAHLKEVKKGRALALLVDGADLVHDAKGQRISEWIPQYVPKGVCLVLSVTTNSDLCNIVSKTKSCVSFPLGPLLLPDRREIVQKELSVYGKKLSDSAFNNQLQTLLMKKGSVSPLYLRLACDELRNYATFEKMKETLQLLPASLCELVQFGLIRLQTQYRGTGLNWTLAALTVSSTGLKDRDLHFLLNLCTDLSSSHTTLNWQEVMKLARNPKTRVPMATFSQLARSLQSLIGSSLRAEPEQSLVLSNPDVKSAFERLYLSDPDDRSRAHLILAAHLWMRSDPHGRNTFLHCDPESLALLPAHLTKSGQCEATRFLLCSYNFLYANVRQGLLRSLIESYRVYEESDEAHKPHCPEASGLADELGACRSFLKRHAPLLSHWPALFVQQALNEPDDSAAHAWAKRAAEEGNIQPVRWMNRSTEPRQEAGELVSTFQWTPSCVSLSPAGVLVAVGTAQGSLHLYHTHTNQEVMSLLSNCDGISGCVFLDERVLWTTSYDGQVEAWDVGSGCRTAQLTAHSNRITGCDVSKDRKHLATVSLDFTLKVWSSHKGTQEASLKNPSPLNCVTFDPEGRLVAVGCWDGMVRVWDWIKQENCMTLSGHQCAVRCVSFSPSSLCLLSSGSLDGEMRLWSVPGSSCLWRSRAHRGSTEALRFLSNGESLLSAGHDGMVQMWSGGLGCSVSVLGAEKKLLKSCESRHTVIAEDPALCVAVNGRCAAVGYHGNGIKLFNIQSGVCVWSTEDLRVSMLCVIWLQASAGLLLSGGVDQRLRLWRKRRDDSVELTGVFGVQKGGILALSQNYTHVASASDDFTIALWLKKDLISDRWTEPTAVCILRGHSGGVTCLAFSPKGDELLSGGKDKALMVWKINSSPPCLSRSFLHCHGDWITGCAWTPSALLSCSNDCRLRLWDVQTGSCIIEISTASSVGTLCCWEGYVMFGSSDGLLTVWKTDLGVITEIQAHSTRLHHCTIASQPGPGMKPENLLVATASDDGSVKVWNPLQVEHRSTLIGHSASVHALASCSGPNFLTVSDDRSLRVWSVNTDMPPRQLESVSALCFLELQDVLVCAFSSGRLEMWQQLKLLYSNQLSDTCITAVSGLPDQQLALGCSDASVSVWKLERDSQQCITGLSKVSSSRLSSSVSFLHYSTTLLGVCVDSTITHVFPTTAGEQPKTEDWFNQVRVLGVQEKGENGTWLLGDEDDTLKLAYLHTHPTHTHPTHTPQGGTPKSVKRPLRICTNVSLEAGWVYTEEEEEEEEYHLSEYMGEEPEKETDGEAGTEAGTEEEEEVEMEAETEEEAETESKKDSLTAAALHDELIVCGDSKGHMWFNETPTLSSWTPRKPAHGDRISALRLTQSLIISASYDRTVKLWDRNTKKQLGVFVCDAPVEVLQVNPNNPSQMVCGDALGQIYFLSWRG